MDSDRVVPLDPTPYRRVVVLTGAGISVASGLRPYRGPGGLWEEVDASKLADARALAQRPDDVWSFFAEARATAAAARPNAAHRALAVFEQRLNAAADDRHFTLLTQNIDRLHQRAGSQRVVELHGSLGRARCTDPGCASDPLDLVATEIDHRAADAAASRCATCGAPLRPDVVLFGEPLPVDAEWAAKRALRDCDLFVAVGTSGTVAPAASFVRWAEYAGARTVLINLEPMQPPNPHFAEEHIGPAEALLPRWLAVDVDERRAPPVSNELSRDPDRLLAEDGDELLEVVDEHNRVIELRRRDEIHRDPRLGHRAVHVLVRNAAGAIYLQKRSMAKRIQPGRWDSSVGGHVDPGESYEQAAWRELAEELGVRFAVGAEDRPPLRRLHDYLWRTAVETEHVRTFELCHEGPFELHPAEIDEGRFWTEQQLREAAGSGRLTPNLEHELQLIGLLDRDRPSA